MGGSITIGVRYSNGEVRCGEGWTNSTPWILSAPELIAGPDDWLHEHFDRNEPAPLAPDGYGLVFIDVVSRNIWSMQGYTSYGKLYSNSVGLEIRHADGGIDRESAPEAYNLMKLHAMGKIIGVRVFQRGVKPISLTEWCRIGPLQNLARLSVEVTFEDIIARCLEYADDHGDILLDIGFEVTRFEENAMESGQFMRTLLSHGIPPDETAWTNFDEERNR